MPDAVTPAWSGTVNGLAGRLLVAFEDLQPGLRHAIFLELTNHSLDPVAVTDQPEFRADLRDASSGAPVGPADLLVSGPIPIPQWAVIPRDAYAGIRVDIRTLGVPTREHGVALLALGGKAWHVSAGDYLLQATLICSRRPDGPANQWVGELELPPAGVVVTAQMVGAGSTGPVQR
jgi:hypothetical protein